jgi:two-component system cell cycle sensor histidine kinase PleC
MSRTHDPSCASCDGEGILPEGGTALRRTVAQRQSASNLQGQEPDTGAGTSGLRQGLIPLSLVFTGIVTVATVLYGSHTFNNAVNHASDRLAILADSTLLQISMAVTRAEDGQEKAAAEPALLNALAYRHVADGIYAYVVSDDGQVVMSTNAPALERLQSVAYAVPSQAQSGRYHDAAALQPTAEKSGTFVARTSDGIPTLTTMRQLPEPFGQLVVTMPQRRIQEAWIAEAGAAMGLVSLALMAFLGVMLLLRATGRSFSDSERAYNARRLRFETALSRARCGLWDWDISRGRIIWSPTMSSLIGLPAEERVLSLGELEAMTHPDDRHFRALAEEIVAGKTSWIDRTFRLRHDNGSWIWIRARAEIRECPDRSGSTELIGIAMDITEQMRLAELSQTADQRLSDAIECVSEAFALWDLDGNLVLSNSKYGELAQLGRGMNDNGDGATSELEAALSSLEHPSGQDSEQSVVVAFPGDRWFRFSQRVTQDGGRVAVGADITDLKNQEDRLREGERQLLNTVAELQTSRTTLQNRTQQLLELAQRYGREKTRAEMANKAKSDFLANMSHELRTPLNAILGFSDVMLSGVLGPIGNPQYEEYCGDIRDSGAYLLEIITDILDMSRIEAGRFTLGVEPLQLSDVVEECVDIMRLQADDKSIETSVEIAPRLHLEGDRRAIKQILLNVLSNAVKFTDEGGAIKVRARTLGDSVRISIEDNGEGIPKLALRKLGRPFEQAGDQHTRSHRGSGLGLAISRSLVELHHGRLSLKSRLGEGTTVSVRLPLVQPSIEDQAAAAEVLEEVISASETDIAKIAKPQSAGETSHAAE